jgi:hypothetical protein
MTVFLPNETRERILERRATYMKYRLTVPITEEQYLWWDDVIAYHFDEALEQYERLLLATVCLPFTLCFSTHLPYVLKIKFRGVQVAAHRFTYAVHCSLPLSQKQVARHQCANFTCLNAAHIELGDQAQNFQDYLAASAYGIRQRLLPRDPLETLR